MGEQASLPGVDTTRGYSERSAWAGEQWLTPRPLAEHLAAWANIRKGSRVLEPSAGRGALAWAACGHDIGHLVLVEIDRAFADALRSDFSAAQVIAGDFLDVTAEQVARQSCDVVLANPPFALVTEFVDHALNFAPRAVTLMPTTALHSADRAPFWSRHHVTRLAVLSSRPRFIGPKNISPATDFCAAEIVRIEDGRGATRMEWWP